MALSELWRLPVQALPSCLLVHFAAADLEESRGNTEASRQIYEDLVQPTLPKEDVTAPEDARAQSRPEVCQKCSLNLVTFMTSPC